MGANLVQDHTQEETTKRYVATITNAGSRIHHLIEELLQASRIEHDQLELRCETVTAQELMDVSTDLFRTRAASRRIALTAGPADGRVIADRERVIEVLSNLLGNALKFTPPGGHITVAATHAGEHVRFAVQDDGPGIAASQLPHLFDRYFRGSRSGARGGLGLGLYICKRLVEGHHGAIGVDSELGRGTTFWFTLPRPRRGRARRQTRDRIGPCT
jgi:signal transduction histidine kinase